ncbi:sulfurtransferase [Acidiferrimicrobium sp. IK]|uniref:sulfurtransferase n=1 Tax=Acidiferrimicrobium sp. IK TaxID=2871700 RepID=UPI0021CB6814|nr:sulfurtransferase [Acidiferrimicrobium sp. IK]MCU4184737.1 sulfurtransferase [Acidiferrimicrobium sp. IK]
MTRALPPTPGTVSLPGPLVDAAWLAAALADPAAAPAVADVRWYLDGRSGRRAWSEGHIPGAIWVDIDTTLSGPVSAGTGRHPLPDPRAFVAALVRLGFEPGRPVVAYDDAGGSIAGRLWWMLHSLGWEVAILDGGLAAWPGPLEAGAGGEEARTEEASSAEAQSAEAHSAEAPSAVAPSGEAPGGERSGLSSGDGRAPVWPAARIVATETLAATLESASASAESNPLPGSLQGAVIIDARSPERFAGEPNPADPRPGHIPGARNAPWAANLDPATGRFLPADALRRRFEALGVRAGTPVVSSCGSGVTACHNLLALHLAGLNVDARLYPGSWSAWGADPSLPIETGPDDR